MCDNINLCFNKTRRKHKKNRETFGKKLDKTAVEGNINFINVIH